VPFFSCRPKEQRTEAVGGDLFTNSSICHLRLEISKDNLNQLRGYFWRKGAPSSDRPEVLCTVREGRTVYTNVAVHLKGAAGSFRPVDDKPALTLKFDKGGVDQRFHGLKKISLNNSVQDPTFLSEKLCRELFLKAGVPVPRADYATVELNGRKLGLFVLVEGWNKQFLKRYFTNVEGNLYDPTQGYDVDKKLEVVGGGQPEGQSELRAIVAACEDKDPTNRLARLEKLVDMDRFVSLLALDCLTWDWDGYAMNKNNYRVFHDLDARRVVFMPHGMDQMFWKPDGPVLTGRSGMVSRALLATHDGRQRVLDRIVQMRATIFTPEVLIGRFDEGVARVYPTAAKEEGFFMRGQYNQVVAQQRQRIAQRFQSVDQQLAGLKNLLQLGINESAPLTNWHAQTLSGSAALTREAQPEALHIRLTQPGAARWVTTVWLEEGAYTITGRIKTRGVTANPAQPRRGAGLRVWSNRKQTDGHHWGWFPYHESRDFLRRGEIAATNCLNTRLITDGDWTEVNYEIELRHPIADLEVYCELYGQTGEAWFDPKSLRITRRTDICP